MYLTLIVGVLCLAAANVSALSDEMLELIAVLHKQCQEESGVPEDLIVNCRTGNFADDNSLKCYMKCLFMQMAVMEDDGTLDEEGMIGVLPDEHKELGTKIIKKCGTKFGSDPCDTAWLTNKCYYDEAPGDYFLP